MVHGIVMQPWNSGNIIKRRIIFVCHFFIELVEFKVYNIVFIIMIINCLERSKDLVDRGRYAYSLLGLAWADSGKWYRV
jgi:hypothetical protein